MLKAFATTGFSWILIIDDNYDDNTLSNCIHYSPGIDENAIKLAALSMLKIGLKVKIIAPYSPITKSKDYSIEIGGPVPSDNIEIKKDISVDSILHFKKPFHSRPLSKK